MSAAVRPMSSADFLQWEERQELRYEFDGANVEAMVGGTAGHAEVKDNLTTLLKTALRGRPCRFFGSDMKLLIGARSRYPDGMVVCSGVARAATFVTEPTVVFEVLSDSTALKDITVKNDEYRSIPSVRRYVMLEQDRIAATVFSREAEAWIGRRLVGPGAELSMPEIGVAGIALSQFYEGMQVEGERVL